MAKKTNSKMSKKTATSKRDKRIEQIICARGRSDGIFLVHTSWFESDAINAVGQLLRDDWQRDAAEVVCVLNTNDSLACVWISRSGGIWVGAGRGNVYTTANVKFTPHRMPNLDYDSAASGLKWNVTTLPDMRNFNYRPNITSIWGTSDDQVFAGTFKGGIYQWDGSRWRQSYSETQSTLNYFHGTGPDNVYCVGGDGTILHFNGTEWRAIPYTDDDNESRTLSGVLCLSKDETLIVGVDGRILHGNENGFAILGEFETGFYGIGALGKEILLAAGDAGVYKLEGKRITNVKDNFATVGVFEANPKLMFIEPVQDPASIIEYDPSQEKPWFRRNC